MPVIDPRDTPTRRDATGETPGVRTISLGRVQGRCFVEDGTVYLCRTEGGTTGSLFVRMDGAIECRLCGAIVGTSTPAKVRPTAVVKQPPAPTPPPEAPEVTEKRKLIASIEGAEFWLAIRRKVLNQTVQEMMAEMLLRGRDAQEEYRARVGEMQAQVAAQQMKIVRLRARLAKMERA